MTNRFDRSTGWIVDRPWITVAVIAVISAIATLGYVDPKLELTERFLNSFQAPEVVELNQDAIAESPNADSQNADAADTLPDVEVFGLDAEAILVVESDLFFTPAGAKAMRQVVADLEDLDYVDNVLWIDEIPILNLFGLNEPLFPRSTASLARFEKARKKAMAHPLVGEQLLSKDGRTMLVLVNFDWLFVESDETCITELGTVARKSAAKFPGNDFQFQVTGRVPTWLTAMNSQDANRYKYQIIGYTMILGTAVVLFRGFTAVIIVALAPSIGVFWTLGIIRFFGLEHNPFNDIVLPVMLSLVGLTDGVHLMVQIRKLKAGGMGQRSAAREGLKIVGLACALTSLTTAIGFGSLTLAHHRIVNEFGSCCVIGVILTFIAVVTVIPLVSSSWFGQRLHIGHDRSLIDQNLGRIGGVIDFVLNRTRAMSITGIVVTVVLIAATLTLRPDERNSNQLPIDSEAALGMQHIDRTLGGLESAEIEVSWSQNVPSDSPEVLTVINKVKQILDAEELIGGLLSIIDLLNALPGEGRLEDRASMIELLPAPLKRAFYTPEHRNASLQFRVQDLGIARYDPVFTRIQHGLDAIELEHPEFSMRMHGSAVWRWKNLYQIVVDLAASLGSASVIIFLVLAAVYRSVRLGLISILPNMFPLAVTGAFLAVTGQSLELVSVCAFTVCLGIAVDDTIHFLTRFTEERREGLSDAEAIRKAFVGVGTALIMTTIVLVVGFSTVIFSDNRDTRIFATMGAMTIASALFGDLIFLPALLARWAGPPDQRETEIQPEGDR
jgi:predicted RND superfamily exporter protein